MTDTIDTAAAPVPAPKRQAAYDEDLLVQLLAEGQLSFRKIADRAGTSAMTVSAVARGHWRPDLHERICRAVEDAHRRARRRAAAGLDAVVKKQFALALESDGETARKACEFIIRTYAHAPDPAGRYVGLPAAGGRGSGGRRAGGATPITREELDLLAALRGGPGAPSFGALTPKLRADLKALVSQADPYADDPKQMKRDQDMMTAAFNYLDRADRMEYLEGVERARLDALAKARDDDAPSRVAPSSEAPQGRSLWVGQQEALSADTPEHDDASTQDHPQAALEGATQHPLDDDERHPQTASEGATQDPLDDDDWEDEYDPNRPPRSDYDADMPETEPDLRRELAGLRRNAWLAADSDYLGRFHDDLLTAGLDDAEARGAAVATDASWLDDPHTMMGREAALITQLAKLRLGDAFVENGDETGTGTEDGARPHFDPAAPLAERLDALRTLEQSDFTLAPDDAEVTDDPSADAPSDESDAEAPPADCE